MSNLLRLDAGCNPVRPARGALAPARFRCQVLAASQFSADIHAVIEQARQLRAAAAALGLAYRPGHAGRVLAEAGLPVPTAFVPFGAAAFDEALRQCRGLAYVLENFAAAASADLPAFAVEGK